MLDIFLKAVFTGEIRYYEVLGGYHEKIIIEGNNINNMKEFYNEMEKCTKQRRKIRKEKFYNNNRHNQGT